MADSDSDSKLAIAMADSDSKLVIAMADSDNKLAQGKARGGSNYIFNIFLLLIVFSQQVYHFLSRHA